MVDADGLKERYRQETVTNDEIPTADNGPAPDALALWMDPSARMDPQLSRLHRSLESGVVPAGALYVSPHQSMKWLALHEAWSPARQSPKVGSLYEAAFEELERAIGDRRWTLTSLGCGGGRKEEQCLGRIRRQPDAALLVDISPSLAMVGRDRASSTCPAHAGVIDLEATTASPAWCRRLFAEADDGSGTPRPQRVLFFLGMLPNMPVSTAWSLLRAWTEPGDLVLVSANLASEAELGSELPGILPQYDNRETREWIGAFFDLHGIFGVAEELACSVESVPLPGAELARIGFHWTPSTDRSVRLPGMAPVEWEAGRRITAFQSLRLTPTAVESLGKTAGLALRFHQVDPSGQEGVFLFERHG